MPSTEYDPKAWSRIPEYGEDMAKGRYHQPCHLFPTVQGFAKPGDSVLEVGCGGQGYANHFVGTGLKYVGLDITPEYLAFVRERFPQFEFIEGDARKMPFEDRSFNVSFCNNLFLHLPPDEMMKAFHEMVRVTKRAIVVISMFDFEDKFATKASSYPEEDGTLREFIYNVYSYDRFRVPGWVTYTAPPSSLLLVSLEVSMQLLALKRDFP